ncbi:MAG: hypothetical protein HKO53_03885, partial [Gemmatimonadetes bacterium]|nr:hypothetical protein [Gemmatimonadota bacterium]
ARIVSDAVARGAVPVAVGDHSDRPGDATHILKAFRAAGIGRVVYGTITSPATLDSLEATGAQSGDSFVGAIGGFTPSGGTPAVIDGQLDYLGAGFGYDRIAVVTFGEGNAVIVTPAYEQVLYPEAFRIGSLEPDDFDVFVVKSRVHFRRGFDETGYAPSIVVVEAPEPFVGTTFLDALPYQNVDLSQLYPYGMPASRR